MKKIILFTIISVLIVTVSITSISAQSQYEIPTWVKGIAGFWAEGKISDSEFGEGLSFLIDSQIIKVPLIQELQNQIDQLKTENSELRSKLNLPEPTPKPQIGIIYLQSDSDTYTNGSVVKISGTVVQ
ncbi:MAG: hypothetical protein OPY09_05090, partial [Nitrosopumilus sp.]|nr:hypothetical protein [Nitrosopumilus sp.]